MVDLLRQGASLTELACPACASPLFKLKGERLWCVRCQKQVVVVKEGESPIHALSSIILSTLESTILTKMQEVDRMIKVEKDVQEIQRLGTVLSILLEDLERIRKMKSSS